MWVARTLGCRESLICTIHKCRRTRDPQQAKRLLACLKERQLDIHPVLGNYLVPVLVACGNLSDAQHLFDTLPQCTIYSWNALITGYINNGCIQSAFNLYYKMSEPDNGIQPNRCAYLALLNGCKKLKDTVRGRCLHTDIIKVGLERDFHNESPLVGNTLVDMYGKCGSVAEARRVFDRLPSRNVISWNVLIFGYSENGYDKEVQKCYQQMRQEGMSPDPVTFVCCLKSCSTKEDVELGQRIHSEIVKRGFEKEIIVGNALIDIYIKTKAFSDANHVFNWLPVRDAVSWNILIGGLAEHGLTNELKASFLQMQQDNIAPDAITLVNSLKACTMDGALDMGREMHMESAKRGLERAAFVGNTLLDMYMKCDFLIEAVQVFERIAIRDAVSWGALIVGYAEHGMNDEALAFFRQMQRKGMSADRVTYFSCLKACGHLGALEVGREIHEEIRKAGLVNDLFICSMLIDMYGKCGSVGEGQEVFDRLPSRDVVLWTAMIQAYGENHDVRMALQCFESMREQGLKPDAIVFACVLAACSHANILQKGQEYFKIMVKDHGVEPNIDHCSCMVDLFARSGHVYEAERFIAAMKLPPNSMIFMTLLTGCRNFGKVELAERCFQQILALNEDVASACLQMAELYASVGRWEDANTIEGRRIHTRTLKKPGNAVIEVDKRLHEFLVCMNQNQAPAELIEVLQIRMKYAGFVPDSDLIARHFFADEIQDTFLEYGDYNFSLVE